ncbi:MAG: YaaL family protein [Oscillospiraceae bacterium]|nr:YaaL family protein [Oscillospiraceae bacterium]
MLALLSEKRRAQKTAEAVRELILTEINEIKSRLSQIETSFNLALDGKLIEAAIYEEMALKSRYAYLLQLARENNIKN